MGSEGRSRKEKEKGKKRQTEVTNGIVGRAEKKRKKKKRELIKGRREGTKG